MGCSFSRPSNGLLPMSAPTLLPTPIPMPNGASRPRRYWPTVAVLLGLTALWFLQLAALLPVVALTVLTAALPRRMPAGIRLAFAVPLAIIGLLATTAVLQPVGLGLNAFFTWAPVTLAATLATHRRDPRPLRRVVGMPDPSTVAWAMGLLAVMFLGSAAFLHAAPPGGGIDGRMALMAGSEDAASHFAIYDTILHVDGFAYTRAAKNYSVQWSYPPGFHLAAASLERALGHTFGTGDLRGGRFDAFWGSTLLSFGYLVAMTGLLAGAIAARFGARDQLVMASAITAAAMTLFATPFGLFQQGFFPQIMALGLLLAIILSQISTDKLGYRMTMALTGVGFVTIAWTWYFLLPVVGLLQLGWFVWNRNELGQRWRFSALVATLTLLASAPPIAESVQAGSLTAVNAGGGVGSVPVALILSLLLAAAALFLLRSRRGDGVTVPLASSLGAAFVFTVAFRSYQAHSIGGAAYFYYKSLYTIVAVAVPVVIGMAVALITERRWRHSVATMLILISVLIVSGLRPDQRSTNGAWLYRDGALASPHRPSFEAYLGQRDRLSGRFIYVWQQTGDSPRDYFGSRWLTAFNGRTTREFFDFMATVVYTQDDKLLAEFMNAHPHEVTIFTANRKLRAELVLAGLRASAIDEKTFSST